ncbi:unnamed protein product [Bathycoccus prasinos]
MTSSSSSSSSLRLSFKVSSRRNPGLCSSFATSSSSLLKTKTSLKGARAAGKKVIFLAATKDGDRCLDDITLNNNNNNRRHFLTSSALAALAAGLNLNAENNDAFAKFNQDDDDEEEWIVNPKRIKLENEPDGYKPNENWTEAKKDVEIVRPPPEQVRDPKDVFESNSSASSNSSSSYEQQEQEEEDNVIEIDIDLVEPGYVPATQKEVDEKTLKQAVNNAKIKQFNNAPDDFPTFIREGYEVNVVTPSGFRKTEDVGSCRGKDQEVTFHYVAYNENGGVIDSTYRKNAPAKARLGIKGMIPGFEEGLSTMKPGGKRRIVVPPELGPPIGPATFFSSKQWEVFDIELIDSKSCSREGGLPGGFGSSIVCN